MRHHQVLLVDDTLHLCRALDLLTDDVLICAGADLTSEEVPSEIDVLVEGSYYRLVPERRLPDGTIVPAAHVPFTVTGEDILAAEAQFNARRARHPNRDLVIDYEHQTLSDDIAPAAGWISAVYSIVRDGKRVLRAKVSSWTERAKQFILNREYRYISPVFALNGIDKETGQRERCILKNAGLTNEPLLDGLAPIIAKHQLTISGKDSTMDELIERVRYFLNMPVTATAEECVAELRKLIGQLTAAVSASSEVTAKDVLAALTQLKDVVAAKADLFGAIGAKDDASLPEVKVMIVAAKSAADQVPTLQAEIAQLKDRELDRELDRIIAKAFTEGRIMPTQKADPEWMKHQREFAAKDLQKFEAFWAKQPVVAPVQPLPPTGDVSAKDITETDLVVARNLGVGEDLLRKHTPAA
jgi:phage I-like protein